MKSVDITDLKSVGCNGRGGSSPPAGTNLWEFYEGAFTFHSLV